ncbi:unnamed protein product [Protopolystoma xenopodis]|uniref:Uncharacterized protein n=1 Tax=Protopolystoma xenopodis TaxID=117903 RepID=A0A3S5A9B0_9PLAT|nr:unnamed protein product [Protopolystoma xenopodis]
MRCKPTLTIASYSLVFWCPGRPNGRIDVDVNVDDNDNGGGGGFDSSKRSEWTP